MQDRISIEALSRAVAVMDLSLTVQGYNQLYLDLFGFEPQTLVGRSVYDLADRESNGAFFDAIELCVRDGVRRTVRNHSQDFGGTFDNIITPMGDCVLVEIADVTQAVADEHAVRVLNSARDHLYSQSDDLMCIIDVTERRVTTNDAFRRLLGDMSWFEKLMLDGANSPEESSASDWRRAGAPDFFVESHRAILNVWTTGQPLRVSDVVSTQIGTRVLSRRITRWDFDGAARGLAIVASDLTELVETQRRAEQARHVQRFAQGVAHDFGNIAQVVGGYAQLLALNPSPEVVSMTADSLSSAANRAVRLAQRIATIARIENVSNSRFDLADLVRRNEDHLREVVGSAIDLRVVAPSAAMVVANPDQLLSAVENLCENAARAMPEGGSVRILVGETNGKIVLTVSDDGPGLPEAIRDHVFEPFVTGSGSTGGTGLGLYLLREYVTSVGGTVEVHTGSAGTTFALTLDAA